MKLDLNRNELIALRAILQVVTFDISSPQHDTELVHAVIALRLQFGQDVFQLYDRIELLARTEGL